MKNEIWKNVWNDFCESQTHLDSLLSKLPPTAKSKVANVFGSFLRRPWTVSKAMGLQIAESPEAFWNFNFIQLKKNSVIHEILGRLVSSADEMPSQGNRDDFPLRLLTEWDSDFGVEVTDRLCVLLSQDPHTMIRVHRRGEAQIQALFPKAKEGRFSTKARIFKGYESVMRTELYERGGYEIQDEGSQLMAQFTLYPEQFSSALSSTPQIQRQDFRAPDLRQLKLPDSLNVVDACAGAGGKTLALADLMEGKGRIFAYDISDKKIQALKKRAIRAQERNIQAKVIPVDQAETLLKPHYGSVDVLLLDAPCSGQGVLKRNPDMKWNRKPFSDRGVDFKPMKDFQQQVITTYLPLVKAGGRLVFGVCTFHKTETENQVKWILEHYPDFRLQYSGYLGPYETDGFFMASFIKV